jgi:hypothetical protein
MWFSFDETRYREGLTVVPSELQHPGYYLMSQARDGADAVALMAYQQRFDDARWFCAAAASFGAASMQIAGSKEPVESVVVADAKISAESGVHKNAHVDYYLLSFSLAWASRDVAAEQVLSGLTPVTSLVPGEDRYRYSLCWAYKWLMTNDPRVPVDTEDALKYQQEPTMIPKDQISWRDAPVTRMLAALYADDADAFNENLHASLLGHVQWRCQPDNHKSKEYESLIAWLPLGLACKAHDRGMKITVESDYIPRALITGQ